jgi:hypothetical protein
MAPGGLILIGTAIAVGVLFTPYKWFLRDNGWSRVDKGQMIGVAIIFVGVIWSVVDALWIP